MRNNKSSLSGLMQVPSLETDFRNKFYTASSDFIHTHSKIITYSISNDFSAGDSLTQKLIA